MAFKDFCKKILFFALPAILFGHGKTACAILVEGIMFVSFKDFSILALAVMAMSKPIDKDKWSGTICAIW